MKAGTRHFAFALGVLLIVTLVTLLPEDVFRTTQGFLVAASALIFLALALATFLTPVRRLLGRAWLFDVEERPTFSLPPDDEWRDLVRPLFAALVVLAVAGLGSLVRGFVGP